MVETLVHGDLPGPGSEDGRGNDHEDKDDPESGVSIVMGSLPLREVGKNRGNGGNLGWCRSRDGDNGARLLEQHLGSVDNHGEDD